MSFRPTQTSVCLTLKWVDYRFATVCPAQTWPSPQGPPGPAGEGGKS